MADRQLDFLEINPQAKPTAAVIWLHGLGVDGHDFEPIVPELQLPDSLPIRFVFPHAPKRSVTINFNMIMPAWFDILDITGPHKVNIDDILESSRQLTDLIQTETRRGLPPDRIILAGPEEVTAEMSRLLPRVVASRLVDRVRMAVTAKGSEVLQMAMPVIDRIGREQERALVNDLVTIAQKSNPTVEKAVLGVNAVMDALNQGRVHRLIYSSGLAMGGYQCAGCEVLLDHCPPDCKCPYCSNQLEETEDLLWFATERVLTMGGRSEEIRDSEARGQLESRGGIGAFLR